MGLFGMGATHYMFGRDHANVCDFFDPYAVRVLWTRGLPSYGIDGPPHEVEGAVLLGVCLLSQVRRVVGEGPLCGRVVDGFLALFCGGSPGGSSAAFCGYAS
jgi:hypothetical protein